MIYLINFLKGFGVIFFSILLWAGLFCGILELLERSKLLIYIVGALTFVTFCVIIGFTI